MGQTIEQLRAKAAETRDEARATAAFPWSAEAAEAFEQAGQLASMLLDDRFVPPNPWDIENLGGPGAYLLIRGVPCPHLPEGWECLPYVDDDSVRYRVTTPEGRETWVMLVPGMEDTPDGGRRPVIRVELVDDASSGEIGNQFVVTRFDPDEVDPSYGPIAEPARDDDGAPLRDLLAQPHMQPGIPCQSFSYAGRRPIPGDVDRMWSASDLHAIVQAEVDRALRIERLGPVEGVMPPDLRRTPPTPDGQPEGEGPVVPWTFEVNVETRETHWYEVDLPTARAADADTWLNEQREAGTLPDPVSTKLHGDAFDMVAHGRTDTEG
jgi:hypothetical protein